MFTPTFLSIVLFIPFLVHTVVDALNLQHARAGTIPAEFTGLVDEKKYADTLAYLKANTQFQMFQRTLTLVTTLAFLWLGGFAYVNQWAEAKGAGPVSAALLFFGALGLLSTLVSWPMSWYHTFGLEGRFGFNRSTVGTFLADSVKGWIVGALLGGAVLAVVLWFFRETGANAWIYAWAFVCAFQILVAFVAPVVIMPLFNKFVPLPEGELKGAIEGYAERMQFRMQGIFTMDGSKRSTKANAYFTGFGRFRRIVLFDTLVQRHPVPELLGVLAHEVGHFKRGHIWKQILLSFAVFLVMFWILARAMGSESLAAAFGFPALSLHAGLLGALWLTGPLSLIVSTLFQFLSRKYEFEADAFARETTGNPVALAEALKRLSVENLSNLTPHPWKVFLDYSHPPVTARVRALRR